MDNQMSIGVVHIVEWLNPGDAETGESLFKERRVTRHCTCKPPPNRP
jgi:hypothetical protein